MGKTLKQGLEYKFSLLAGELKEKKAEIDKINSLFESLPLITARTVRIEHLLNCAEDLLTEIDPTWSRTKVKAVRPSVHKIPVAIGRTSKTALDVLREAERGLTAKEIMQRICSKEGVEDPDAAMRQRITNAVDSTLRSKLGVLVEHDDAMPRRWSILAPKIRAIA